MGSADTHVKYLRRETKEQVLRITARVWPEHTWNWTEVSKYEVCGRAGSLMICSSSLVFSCK